MPDLATTAKAARVESQKEAEKTHAEYKERTKGNCTPTQEEIDLIKRGVPLFHKEDGSTQPVTRETTTTTRQMESGGSKGEYSTRVSRASSSERASVERTSQSSTEPKGE